MTIEFNRGKYKVRQSTRRNCVELLAKMNSGKYEVVKEAELGTALSNHGLLRLGRSMAALYEEEQKKQNHFIFYNAYRNLRRNT